MANETSRQIIHIAASGFAVLLAILPGWLCVTLAAVAVFFNLSFLPRLAGHGLFRSWERRSGRVTGALLYSAAVLYLVAVFYKKLAYCALVWGIMAWGDGFATLTGRRLGGPRLPWSRDKTLPGLLAFALFGFVGGFLLAGIVGPAASPGWLARTALLAAVLSTLAALIESLDCGIDDNITVPAALSLAIVVFSSCEASMWASLLPALARRAGPAAIAAGIAALGANLLGYVRLSGAICGFVVSWAILCFAGWPGFAVVAAVLILASLATKLGLSTKERLGVAEPHGGKRGAASVLSNCTVGTILALCAQAGEAPELFRLAFAAAFATAAADTVASEVGKSYGRKPRLLVAGGRVEVGRRGAVSVQGTAAGASAGAIVAAVAAVTGAIGVWPGVLIVSLSAFLGMMFESLVAARSRWWWHPGRASLNVINTVIGASLAIVLAKLMIR